jgi:hypothetical protein
MVTQEGTLPTRQITNLSLEKVPILANNLMLTGKLTFC